VGQFRLEVADHVLGFSQETFCPLSGFHLFPKALPRCFKVIAGMPVILVVIAMNDGDWNLAVADKTAPVGMWPVGRRGLLTGVG